MCHKNALIQEFQSVMSVYGIYSVCSREEILTMQEVARSKGMEVIPLVQSFGHMEVRQTSHCCLQMFVSYKHSIFRWSSAQSVHALCCSSC